MKRILDKKILHKKLVQFGFCALAISTSSAFAQSNSIKMLVAFPPGGPVDFVARTIAEPLGKELGVQIIVENKFINNISFYDRKLF